MTILSVTDASRMAGVSRQAMYEKIESGELNSTPEGVAVSELIRIYPSLKPLAHLKIREVKKVSHKPRRSVSAKKITEVDVSLDQTHDQTHDQTLELNGTVDLLVRELEWNKELLEKTNRVMEKQLADQRALIADQARRLDEKDRFWGRQVEIAQSLLAAPAPLPQVRKKLFGIF